MPDYSKGKVYRILQDNEKTVYIGSTTQPLSARMAQHRKNIKHLPHFKLYTLMAAAGVDHFSIELVADFPCERSEQLRAEEGRHIRLNKTVEEGANQVMPGRTKKESSAINYAANRDAVVARTKAYNAANKEAVAARYKAWVAANAEAIAARKKAYRAANKQTINARTKAWDAANAEAIAARKKAAYQRKKAERAAAAEPVAA